MSETEERLSVVVVDDEPMARTSLVQLLSKDSSIQVVATCSNGFEAVNAVREHSPELLILDIQMPGMDGFEVLDELDADEVPVVLFATAYDQFAVRAFEVHAADYLLKPFDDERFQVALGRAKERVRASSRGGLDQLLESVAEDRAAQHERDATPKERLSIHREGRIELVDVDDIIWVEAADQYVRIHTPSGEHLMRQSLSHLEKDLDPAVFMRIHRSAIVRMGNVRRLESLSGGNARVLIGDATWVPVSRSRVAAVRRRLG